MRDFAHNRGFPHTFSVRLNADSSQDNAIPVVISLIVAAAGAHGALNRKSIKT
jgi:hypothetical protein